MEWSGYFHELLRRYIRFYTGSQNRFRVLEVNPVGKPLFGGEFPVIRLASDRDDTHPELATADWILLNGNLHYERDIISFLRIVRKQTVSEIASINRLL